MLSKTKRILQIVGGALAVCVPAVVVAQFQTNQPLTAARLNQATSNTCRIVVRTGASGGCTTGTTCNADCPVNHVVMGGGCRTSAAGNGLRGSAPRFSSGGFPDPDSFTADLQGGGAVDGTPGSPANGVANPRWNSWGCESDGTGTVQTAYAICCPLVQ